MDIDKILERLAIVETDVKWIKDHIRTVIKNRPNWISVAIALLALVISAYTIVGKI